MAGDMVNSLRRAARLSLVVAILLVPGFALGALGEDEASVQVDGVRLKGAASVRYAQHYALHEFVQPSGTAVREYVSPSGKVFAVAWQGPVIPDLRQVLGAHFDRYVAAARDKRVKRTPVVIREPSLVVVTWGHMRAFSGRAYVPAMVPQGVDPEALQ
jgi:hypothetical protein